MLHIKFLDSVKILSTDYIKLLESLHAIAAKIKQVNQSVRSIVLFGSFHKGNYTPDSDVDLLIVLDEENQSFLSRRDRFAPFFYDTAFDVNILAYTDQGPIPVNESLSSYDI